MANSKYNEIDIYEFLRKYADHNIIYVSNPGNAGDKFIVAGTMKVFDDIDINYKIGSHLDWYGDEVLFYAGGGNLVGEYSECREFILRNRGRNEIVILPHTIKGEENLISESYGISYICRDRVSYEYVEKHIPQKENLYLSKDLAFYVNPSGAFFGVNSAGVCNCFRTDCERIAMNLPVDNVDLSVALDRSSENVECDTVGLVVESIFSYLSRYDVINTNRLHIAIAGSLLDKKVNFYPNSYYKNRAVFEYSLNDIYPNTNFYNCPPIEFELLDKNYVLEDEEIDFLRDLGIKMESVDIDSAIQLMEIAHKSRPSGKFINYKLQEYRMASEDSVSWKPNVENTRRLAIAGLSDSARWRNRISYSSNWYRRSELASKFIDRSVVLLDLGAGEMHLKSFLPKGSQYIPADLEPLEPSVMKLDLNIDDLPGDLYDVISMLGVAEYIFDVKRIFIQAFERANRLLVSYCCLTSSSEEMISYRRDVGWVNDYSQEDFIALAEDAGWKLIEEEYYDQHEGCLQLIYFFGKY